MNIKNKFNNLKNEASNYFVNIFSQKIFLATIFISLIVLSISFWTISLSSLPIFQVSLFSFFLSYLAGFMFLCFKYYDKKYRKFLMVDHIIVGLITSILIATFIFTFNQFLPRVASFFIAIILYALFIIAVSNLFKKENLNHQNIAFNKRIRKLITFTPIKIVTIISIITWGVISLGFCYSSKSNSDIYTMTFMANSIVSGNPFLSGWIQSAVAFVTTDLIPYDIFVSIFGVSQYVDIFAAWITMYVIFLLGLLIIKKATNFNYYHLIVYFLFTLLLGPANYFYFKFHSMVTVYGFVVLLLLDSFIHTHNKKTLYLFSFLTALGVFGDKIFLFFFIFPIIIYCLICTVKFSNKKTFYLKLIAVLFLSVVIGFVFEKLFYLIGGAQPGYSTTLTKYNLTISPYPSNWIDHFIILNNKLFIFVCGFNVDNPTIFEKCISSIFLSLVYIASLYNIIRFLLSKNNRFFAFSLSTSFMVYVLIFSFTFIVETPNVNRYYQSFIIISSLNIIFMVDDILKSTFKNYIKNTCKIVVILSSSLLFVVNAVQNLPLYTINTGDAETIINELEKNNLNYGFASVWISHKITVKTNERIKVIPTVFDGDTNNFRKRYYYEYDGWYKIDERFTYIITTDNDKYDSWDNVYSQFESVTSTLAINFFGSPANIIPIPGTDIAEKINILIYDYDISTKISGCLHYQK